MINIFRQIWGRSTNFAGHLRSPTQNFGDLNRIRHTITIVAGFSIKIVLRAVVEFLLSVTLSLRAVRFLSEYLVIVVLHTQVVRVREVYLPALHPLYLFAPLLMLRWYLRGICLAWRAVVSHGHLFVDLGRRRGLHFVEFTLLWEPVASSKASCKVRLLRYLLLVSEVTNIRIVLLVEPRRGHDDLALRILVVQRLYTCEFWLVHRLYSDLGHEEGLVWANTPCRERLILEKFNILHLVVFSIKLCLVFCQYSRIIWVLGLLSDSRVSERIIDLFHLITWQLAHLVKLWVFNRFWCYDLLVNWISDYIATNHLRVFIVVRHREVELCVRYRIVHVILIIVLHAHLRLIQSYGVVVLRYYLEPILLKFGIVERLFVLSKVDLLTGCLLASLDGEIKHWLVVLPRALMQRDLLVVLKLVFVVPAGKELGYLLVVILV